MNTRRHNGFTLVELMVGMLAASVLAITIGSMLFYAYMGWRATRAVSEMERDGSLAMHTMSRVIRGAALRDIKFKSFPYDKVVISNVNNSVEQSFYSSGSSLIYTNRPDGMTLVQDLVTGFVCVQGSSTNQVKVELYLFEPTAKASMVMTKVITLRN